MGLGPVHGGVGVAQEVLGAIVARRSQHDPGTERYVQFAPLSLHGLPKRLLQVARHPHRIVERLDVLQEDGEFIATHPGNRPVDACMGPVLLFSSLLGQAAAHLLERFLKTLGDQAEHAIADEVAQTVVDILELVDVQEDDGQAFLRSTLARPAEGVRQTVEEQGPVRKIGQGIVERQVNQLLLHFLPLVHVGLGAREP